jgi:SAM-dependent methyltransferase
LEHQPKEETPRIRGTGQAAVPGELEFSPEDLASMGAVLSPGAGLAQLPEAPELPNTTGLLPASWPSVSSITRLGGSLVPSETPASAPAQKIPVDEMGLELAYGVEPPEPHPERPESPLFRADVIPGGDEEVVLPFVLEADMLPPAEPEAAKPPPQPRREAPAPPAPWFERFFDEDYLELEPQPSAEQTRREVDLVVASFALAKGARILDLCCGTGRHTLELAARGYEVVGLDLSRVMLDRAVQAARARKLAVDFVHGDVRNLAFRRIFDGILFWGTSFGYFRDAENALVLRRVARALRPQGHLLLQVANRDFVLRDLPKGHWRRCGNALIHDEIDLDPRTNRFRVRRAILRSDGRERQDLIDLRGYSLHELLDLLHSEGFVPLEISGRVETRGAYFGAESPWIIVLAELR